MVSNCRLRFLFTWLNLIRPIFSCGKLAKIPENTSTAEKFLSMKDTVYYCLVAIMKQFVHLMIDFYWLRSPLRWADIFRGRQEKWCLCLETWQTGKVKTKLTSLSMNYHKNFFKAV